MSDFELDLSLPNDPQEFQEFQNPQELQDSHDLQDPVLPGPKWARVIHQFNSFVNMTSADLETWLASEPSREAGLLHADSDADADAEIGPNIVEILKIREAGGAYSDEQLTYMGKISACLKQQLALEKTLQLDKPREELQHSKPYTTLRNLGHDFLPWLEAKRAHARRTKAIAMAKRLGRPISDFDANPADLEAAYALYQLEHDLARKRAIAAGLAAGKQTTSLQQKTEARRKRSQRSQRSRQAAGAGRPASGRPRGPAKVRAEKQTRGVRKGRSAKSARPAKARNAAKPGPVLNC